MGATSGAHQQTTDTQLEVLWVGQDSRAREALLRLGVRVTLVRPEQCLQQVAARAPDMLVFSGAAAARADAIVSELRAQHSGGTLPVIVISPEGKPTDSAHRRAGIVTCLAAELAPSIVAAEIRERLCRLAALPAQREVALSWHDIDGWLRSAVQAGGSGFLITSAPVGAIALGPNGRLAPSTELLREASTRPLGDQPSAMKFLELPPSRLLVLSKATGAAVASDISGAQIVVVHPELERGEALCAELVAAGATAQALGIGAAEIASVTGLAPALIVIAASALVHANTASLLEDARLDSVSWLVLDESELEELPPGQILAAATALVAAGQTLRRRMAAGELIVDRIESLGAAGWLKAVGRCEQPLTLVLKGAAGRSELLLDGRKMREATFVSLDGGAPQKGRAALQAALALPFGRVLVGPHEAVMAREAALQVEHEPAPYQPRDEPGPSEIRERPLAARTTVEPNAAAPLRPFRPSTPTAFSAKAKPQTAAGRVLSLKPAASASEPQGSAPVRAEAKAAQPPPAPTQPSQRGSFDVALARNLAGSQPGRLSAPSITERPAEPLSVRVSVPIAPIASELEPTPAAPPLPGPPPSQTRKHLRPWAVAAGCAAVAIGAALLAITATQPATQQVERTQLEATSAGEVKAPSQGAQPGQTASARAPAAASTAAAAERSAKPSEQRPQAPAQSTVVLTRIPRGSEADALLERAKQAGEQRRHKEAEALLAEVLTRHPNDFEARYHMALTLVRQRRFADARAQLAKARELNEESASAWLLEGDIFLQEGRRPQALRAWNRCIDVSADLQTCRERLARWR